jgi:hypothetical protein
MSNNNLQSVLVEICLCLVDAAGVSEKESFSCHYSRILVVTFGGERSNDAPFGWLRECVRAWTEREEDKRKGGEEEENSKEEGRKKRVR